MKKDKKEKTGIFQKISSGNKPLVIHLILVVLVLLIMAARLLRVDFYSAFLCLLTLILFNIPLIVDRTFKVKLPNTLEIIVLLFIFAAEILGELGSFYTRIPWWDTMLHTVNGFLMAAIGFALIDVLNNHPRFHIRLSPIFVAVVAFCFSMTVGVLWEFFEFGMDCIAGTDTQKDSIVRSISSVELNSDGINTAVRLNGIERTVITYTQDGTAQEYTIEGGYLDVGIRDTMKDLIVNCIGAVVFSVIGYFYIIGRNKGIFVSRFIPRMKTAEELAEEQRQLEALKEKRAARREKKKGTP